MLKSLISAFAVCATAFGDESRRLLQAPAFPSVNPPASQPAQPAQPAIPVAPAPPTQGGGGAVVPIIPPPPSAGSGTPLEIKCGDPCIDTAHCPSTCAQQVRVVENPGNSFVMECVATGSCAQSHYTFTYSGGMTKYLEGIVVGANYALYGSTITIDNSARGQGLTVRSIECGGGLCAGATFEFINADFGDIKCEEYVGCGAGCTVSMPPDAPVPCDQVSTT